MRILDSNLIIYSALPTYAYLRPLLKEPDTRISAISRLEVMGFHRLDESSRRYFNGVFAAIPQFDVDRIVLDEAIRLRRQRKMSIGDAIIGATAVLFQLDLYTRNTADFEWIEGLTVINPVL
jgi:toxin FitB